MELAKVQIYIYKYLKNIFKMSQSLRVLITALFNVKLFPEEIYFLSKMPSEINPFYIGVIFVFSLLITFLATIFPSLSAAKLDPIKALKYE